MKRTIMTGLAVLAIWWGGADAARAQFIAPGFGGVSPFFPLGGGTVRTHPFGPIQMQPMNPAITELQQSINRINPDGSLRGQIAPNAVTTLQTGHPTTYFNTGHYYPNTFLPGGSTNSSNTGFGGGLNSGANAGGYSPQSAGFGGFVPGVGGFIGAGGFGGNRPFNAGGFGAGFR